MKTIPCCLVTILLLAMAVSCKKSDNPTCTAGDGGSTEIVVFATHNGISLPNPYNHPDSAFVKYGTITSPGTSASAYDKIYVGEGGENHIHLTNLHCGSYFIYRIAFDTTTNTRYTGGLGITFSQSSGEIDTTISVN